MSLPLYAAAQELINELSCPVHANAGLWYNKFCNRWEDRGRQWTLNAEDKRRNDKGNHDTRKTSWIKSVTGKPCGDSAQLQENLERYITLVKLCGGDVRVYRTSSRFVTGLGNEHPVENGFTWHHILGTPYLLGSSVKGVLRDWVENWLDDIKNENRNGIVNKYFGSQKNAKAAGDLIVFDALPVKPVKLETEIMTPHYGEYYQDTDSNKPPADWYSPVPIPYLTVAENQLFVFGLAPRMGKTIDLQQVFSWLDLALETMGAGAKTASGYGCFQAESSFKLPVVQQRPKSQNMEGAFIVQPMSAIRKEMEDDGYANPNLNIFMNALTVKWLDKMESNDTSEVDRKETAHLLADWYRHNKPGDWEKPKPKNKNYVKVQRIKEVLSEN